MDTLPIQHSRLAPLLRPLQAFLSSQSAGGIVLMAATLTALAWANSPWSQSYFHLWHSNLSIGIGSHVRSMSLEHCVNDGLMVIFFLLVGLEIKRELLLGELASFQRAAFPVAAAFGGMVIPALVYCLLNFRGQGARGWGIPMATDIAFAVGVLALVGRRIPVAAKVFLLAVAIVDDLGAVLVIAFFYTSSISTTAIAVAAVFFAGLILLNILRVHSPLPYVLLGIGLWAATLASGVHATIAGILLALTIPATRQIQERPYVDFLRKMLDIFERETNIAPDTITPDQSHAIKAVEEASQFVQTPLARVEHALLWPVNFLIIPLFALANAGVDLRSGMAQAFGDKIMWGVFLGLILGKPVGILLFSWIAVKTRLASLPKGVTQRHVAGIAVLCGIGFTMSLFVANLAFPNNDLHLSAAKVGILAASLAAGLVGAAIIATSKAPPNTTTDHPKPLPLLVAHRGESFLAPENTMAAFDLAWKSGDRAIELDIHLTADNRIVVCHDPDTFRTSGNKTKLILNQHSLSQIQQVDVGAGRHCPALEDVYANMPPGTKCFTEIKSGPETVPALAQIYKKSGRSPDQIVIISFHPSTLQASKRALPELKHYLLGAFQRDEKTNRWKDHPNIDDFIAQAKEIHADGLDLGAHDPLNATACQKIKAAGLELHVWTIDEVETARKYAHWGADSITTNRAAWLQEQLQNPK